MIGPSAICFITLGSTKQVDNKIRKDAYYN